MIRFDSKMSIITSTIQDKSMIGLKLKTPQAYTNLASFLKRNNLEVNNVAIMGQVHGDNISVIDKRGFYVETDGLVITNPDIVMIISHSDCVPLFFYYDDIDIYGGTHAGWQGIHLGIIEKMIGQISAKTKKGPEKLKVVSGPFICTKHYDISANDERAGFFPTIPLKNGRLGIDLRKELIDHLLKLGIKKTNILLDKDCTACLPEKYWSFHTQNQKGVGMVSVYSATIKP